MRKEREEEQMSIHISKIVVLLMLSGSAFGQQPTSPKQDIRTVHGADGLDYVFDMNHAVRSQNGTSIPLYIGPPPVVPQKGKESFVGFNCQGGFVMLDNTGAPTSAWGVNAQSLPSYVVEVARPYLNIAK